MGSPLLKNISRVTVVGSTLMHKINILTKELLWGNLLICGSFEDPYSRISIDQQ